MKPCWQVKRKAESKDTFKASIMLGANSQVVLENFARYFEVDARILPAGAKSSYHPDPALVKENIDENTIGVFVILRCTYTGHHEPVEQISKILDDYKKKTEIDIAIHVGVGRTDLHDFIIALMSSAGSIWRTHCALYVLGRFLHVLDLR
ncbi:hypothetical protein K432DRAFT_191310 [Lepidopterella palustris CBS 459.81]|uniref:Uncharacterized protein n=1 Tax=Lepidopterella palustris CBS 459.81 TaxID=1314670 RepID=A0A8E2DZQ8_9PEZI|nr:hypothetical protein K432DRAFT_191310 [Lepidopterella palustris CBS 459.81]